MNLCGRSPKGPGLYRKLVQRSREPDKFSSEFDVFSQPVQPAVVHEFGELRLQ